jgi:hypothetical protein
MVVRIQIFHRDVTAATAPNSPSPLVSYDWLNLSADASVNMVECITYKPFAEH